MRRIFACDIVRKKKSVLAALFLLASSGFALLTGCGMGTVAPSSGGFATSGPALAGRVYGGNNPVVGSTIQLWAADENEYPLVPDPSNPGKLIVNPDVPDIYNATNNFGPRPLVNCTGAKDAGNVATPPCVGTSTDGTGSFTITNTYDCPSNSLVYITASGGNPGLVPTPPATTVNNPQLVLMAALGSCATLKQNAATTFIDINEVTTVASAYALAQFARMNSNGGITVATNATNIQGLANAMATVSNLVDTSTGAARAITPFYSGAYFGKAAYTYAPQAPVAYLNTSTVPQARINTLADMLATCVNTPGVPSGSVNGSGSGSACGQLLSAATPSATASATTTPSPYPNAGVEPADTLQAALAIAQNPGNNADALWQLVNTGDVPFPPLASEPTDWTIALTFSAAGLGGTQGSAFLTPTNMQIDANGNIFVHAYRTSQPAIGLIAEFNNLGEAQTAATSVSSGAVNYGGYQNTLIGGSTNHMLLDRSGNLWTTAGAPSFSEFATNPSITFTQTITTSGATSAFNFDGAANLWLEDSSALLEYPGTANSSTTPTSYSNPSSDTFANGITFDANGNLWGTGSSFYAYSYSGGTGTQLGSYSAPYNNSGQLGVPFAADNSGNIYACDSSQANILVFNTSNTSGPVATYSQSDLCFSNPIVDGLGNLWNQGFGSTAAVLQQESVSGTTITPIGVYSGWSSSEGLFPIDNNLGALTTAVDGSGNVWVLNADLGNSNFGYNNAISEFVGLAAPVMTPTSLALNQADLATRP